MWKNKKLDTYGLLKSDIEEDNPILRMEIMCAKIRELISMVNPDFIVIEQVQFQNNYRVYGQLSQLQGVIFTLLFEINKGFCLIEPTAWKSFCKIKGRKRIEQKANTIQMVKEKFNKDVTEDEADSIGIGLWAINNLDIKGD